MHDTNSSHLWLWSEEYIQVLLVINAPMVIVMDPGASSNPSITCTYFVVGLKPTQVFIRGKSDRQPVSCCVTCHWWLKREYVQGIFDDSFPLKTYGSDSPIAWILATTYFWEERKKKVLLQNLPIDGTVCTSWVLSSPPLNDWDPEMTNGLVTTFCASVASNSFPHSVWDEAMVAAVFNHISLKDAGKQFPDIEYQDCVSCKIPTESSKFCAGITPDRKQTRYDSPVISYFFGNCLQKHLMLWTTVPLYILTPFPPRPYAANLIIHL